MKITDALPLLIGNRDLYAKRKGWINKKIAVFEKGWASANRVATEPYEPPSNSLKDNFIMEVVNGVLVGLPEFSLDDLLATDWIVTK